MNQTFLESNQIFVHGIIEKVTSDNKYNYKLVDSTYESCEESNKIIENVMDKMANMERKISAMEQMMIEQETELHFSVFNASSFTFCIIQMCFSQKITTIERTNHCEKKTYF